VEAAEFPLLAAEWLGEEEAESGRRWPTGRRMQTRRTAARPRRRPARRRGPPRRRPGPTVLAAEPTVIEAPPPGEPQGSEQIRWVQHRLNQLLNLNLPVDGLMSVATRSAVRSFQEKQGLPVDGIVGPPTEKALIDAGAQPPSSAGGEKPAAPEEQELSGNNELSFGSPQRTARPVRANFVSCHPPSAAIRAITGPDPVGTIQKANTRAIQLLDKAINDLQNTRSKIVAGAAPATTVPRRMATALRCRFAMNPNDRKIWTGSDRGSVHVLIRRIRGARQILADGWMKYTCLGAAAPATVTIARGGRSCTVTGCEAKEQAFTCGGNSRIVLCPPWWQDNLGIAKLDAQAGTLLHECFHIYFGFIGDQEKGNLANAHCYEQLVFTLNGLAIPKRFKSSCPSDKAECPT
jgi:peptidoglycan hydrolase-like protein with peptidoglycan-binding domain